MWFLVVVWGFSCLFLLLLCLCAALWCKDIVEHVERHTDIP
jgi:hypothetical protein